MDKREKVIKAFEFCLMPPNREEIENDVCSHEDCPYYREYNGGKCISAAVSDALALLKAQEPVKPEMIMYTGAGIGISNCPQCGCKIDEYHNDKFCGSCGQAVKWE